MLFTAWNHRRTDPLRLYRMDASPGFPAKFNRKHDKVERPAQVNPSKSFRNLFEIPTVARRGELSYSWEINCEPGNSTAAPGARARDFSLAAGDRRSRPRRVVRLPHFSLGDETDL